MYRLLIRLYIIVSNGIYKVDFEIINEAPFPQNTDFTYCDKNWFIRDRAK